MATSTLDDVDEHLKAIISNLYILIVQTYDFHGAATQYAMTEEIKKLIQNLLALTKTARRLPTHIPLDIIEYVEKSRNPDIYTREFVELVMRYNQSLKGQSEAFAQFRDILAQEMMSVVPEMMEDVRKVVESTGGSIQT